MPLVCYVSKQEMNAPLNAERLLRLLGVSGKLSGFYYMVYMLELIKQKPDHVLLVMKRLYWHNKVMTVLRFRTGEVIFLTETVHSWRQVRKCII